MAKTSLEKSHSASSNAKLTFVCLGLALFFAILFIGLGLLFAPGIDSTVPIICVIVGGVGTLLQLLLINSFKR